jgi:Ni,Fe-hydrogenase III small subunit
MIVYVQTPKFWIVRERNSVGFVKTPNNADALVLQLMITKTEE